jgi:FMN-dependent oxidoreductase (nitrilotriacetate monooxygenase family)
MGEQPLRPRRVTALDLHGEHGLRSAIFLRGKGFAERATILTAQKFHLGWFLQGSSVQAWNERWTGNIDQEWMDVELFCDIARALERAGFDYVLIEDSSYVGESYNDSMEIYLAKALSTPRQDPIITGALMTQATSRIGIVPTVGTYQMHPYQLARTMGTLDQVSRGRIGWNMVTGSSDPAARNFGLEGMPAHDHRYDVADEYMDATNALWASWEPDAIVADRERGVLADASKVHHVDFQGEYFTTHGPLNSGPLPQGRPVIAQAGGSPRGREFAARHADTVVAGVRSVEAMREFREDIRARMERIGRKPDDCKVLFLVSPILADTKEDALRRQQRQMDDVVTRLDERLATFGKTTNINFAQYDLDAPVGELTTNGHQQSLDQFLAGAQGKTLREAAIAHFQRRSAFDLTGSPSEVADTMGELMDAVGGDGFLITLSDTSRKSVAEIADGLVPELQRRGLTRTSYTYDQFRDNLLEF